MCKLQEIFKGVRGKENVFGGLQNVLRRRLDIRGRDYQCSLLQRNDSLCGFFLLKLSAETQSKFNMMAKGVFFSIALFCRMNNSKALIY